MTAEQFYAMAVEMTEQGLGNIVHQDMVPDAVAMGMPEDMAVTLGVRAYNEARGVEWMPRAVDMETVDLALVGEEIAGTEPTTRIGGADYLAELVLTQPYIAGQRVTAWDVSTWNVVSDPADYPVYEWPSVCHNGNAWDLDIDFGDMVGTATGTDTGEPLPSVPFGWDHV